MDIVKDSGREHAGAIRPSQRRGSRFGTQKNDRFGTRVIVSRLEAIATTMEAIASRLEATVTTGK